MKRRMYVACVITAILALMAQGQGGFLKKDRWGKETNQGTEEFSYGSEDLQKLDYWRPNTADAPLVVFVHGGGWKRGDKKHSSDSKASHYLEKGYAFASLNYRLVPDVKVEDQAHDVAAAVSYLRKNAQKLGFDPKRIVLIGHSAGAHLVALVGTDPQYLKKAGLDVGAIRGVIPLDGACYDVPKQVAHGGALMKDTYREAFGEEKQRQLTLSPTHQAAAPNVPAFLILHVQRIDGAAQSKALGQALKNAGTNAEVMGFKGIGMMGHMEINRRMGDEDYEATAIVDNWLKRIFKP